MKDGSEESIEVGDTADEESIFLAARRLLGREQQQLFVEQTCGRGTAKTHRILSLLAVERDDPTFLQQPAARSRLTALFLRKDLREGDAIGPYWLLRALGTGGMGDVWLAEQRAPVYRRVALKLMKNGFGTEADLRLFDSERQILAILDHPGIVKLLDAGETDEGRPWYAMEHVTGPRITDYCIQHRLTLEERVELLLTVLDAIDHAHQRGVVHCDLKPANILITESNGVPRARLIDFGVALALRVENSPAPSETEGSPLQQTADNAAIQGTLAYMSPEQAARSSSIDRRSDVYSIGAVLYELCCECAPLSGPRWEQSTVHDRLQMIRETVPLSLKPRRAARDEDGQFRESSFSRGPRSRDGVIRWEVLFHDIDHIAQKALAKNRETRYATVQQLADDLRNCLSYRSLSVGHETIHHRCLKFLLRHRSSLVISAVLALCILIAGIAGRTFALRDEGNSKIRIQPGDSAAAEISQYVDEIQAAQLYANQGEIEQLGAILLRLERLSQAGRSMSDSAGTADRQRRFELTYLSRLAQLKPERSQPHRGKVFAVAFTPDGTGIVSGSGDQDHTLLIQDGVTGETRTRFPEFTNDLNAVCFGDNGRLLITAEEAGLIRGWDVTGDLAHEVFRLPEFAWPPGYVLLSPDEKTLIVTEIEWRSRHWRLTVWNLATKTQIGSYEGHRALGICPSVNKLVVATELQQIQVWSLPGLQHEKTCDQTFPDLSCGSVFGETLIAAGNRTGDLWLWNPEATAADLLRMEGDGGHAIRDVEFSVDGQLLFAAYNDGVIRVWDTKSKQMIHSVKSKSGEAWSLDASADGQFLVAGFEGGYLEKYSIRQFTNGFQRLISKVPMADGADLFGSPELLIVPQLSGKAVDVIRLSDLQTIRTVRIENAAQEEMLQHSVAVDATGEILLATTQGRIFVAEQNSSIAKLRIDSTLVQPLIRPSISADGRLCSVSPRDPSRCSSEDLKYCSIRDLTDGSTLVRLTNLGGVKAIHLPYQFVSFSDDGKFVSGQKEGVYLWSSAPKTAAALNVPLASIVCSQMVTHIARLPSSERFLIATADETLHLWDPNSPSEITRLYAHGIQVQTTAFSPDERTLAIGALNGQIQLRDLQSGQLLLTLHGGAGRVLQLRFDEDGTRLYALCETEQGSGELLMWGRVHGVGNDRD